MTNNHHFAGYAEALRGFIREASVPPAEHCAPCKPTSAARFNELALALFALQFAHSTSYHAFCASRRTTPETVRHWTEIPAIPVMAFKELDLTSLPPAERTTVFYSSGTTQQRPSRHFHHAESLAVYEASLLPWFAKHLLAETRAPALRMICLTPSAADAPHSSLAHMLETVRREFGTPDSWFAGRADPAGAWTIEMASVLRELDESTAAQRLIVLLGTAFNLVNLLDALAAQGRRFQLPAGSRVMETGGYKGRSRALPKAELHALLTAQLGLAPEFIVCEYGMSELSSQAYDRVAGANASPASGPCVFRFPPWARARVVSPETGREVAEGETGLIQVCDLANVFSVLAVQTEDLGIRRGDGFELLGRAAPAEPRGCSLLAV